MKHLTRAQALTWLALLVVAVLAIIYVPDVHRALDPQQPVDTLAVITKILDGGDLQVYWPGAAKTMLRMSRVFELDPLLIPVIARVESPHPRYRNIGGLTVRGKIVQYESYTYGTYRMAELLARLKPVYQGERGPNIPTLASAYCPANKDKWAAMVSAIYQQAIK